MKCTKQIPSHPARLQKHVKLAVSKPSPVARQPSLDAPDNYIILSSDEEEEPVPTPVQVMRTLIHLNDTVFASIRDVNADMRGSCVQVICELLNSDHAVSILSCTNTNVYTLLCKGELAQAKRLVQPPQENTNTNWITPPLQRSSVQSKVLLIPCLDETIGHWFLVAILTMEQTKGSKRVLIFDSINHAAGKRRIPTIRKLLRKFHLISKRDTCEAMRTRGQSERECGACMVTYMIVIGRILQEIPYTSGNLKGKIDIHLKREIYVANESTDVHMLAKKTRQDVLRTLQTKQLALMAI